MTRWWLLALVLACSKPATKQEEPARNDPQIIQFCARNYFTMMKCFKDDQFWDVFSTLYFAKSGTAVDEEQRKKWIGVLKDDLLALYRDRAFEKNCEASLRHTKAPSVASMQKVDAAREKSCVEFGSAFGYMTFHEGGLHDPR